MVEHTDFPRAPSMIPECSSGSSDHNFLTSLIGRRTKHKHKNQLQDLEGHASDATTTLPSPRDSECSDVSDTRCSPNTKTPKHVSFSKSISFKTIDGDGNPIDGKVRHGPIKTRDGYWWYLGNPMNGMWRSCPTPWTNDEGDHRSPSDQTRTSEPPGSHRKESLTPPVSKERRARHCHQRSFHMVLSVSPGCAGISWWR